MHGAKLCDLCKGNVKCISDRLKKRHLFSWAWNQGGKNGKSKMCENVTKMSPSAGFGVSGTNWKWAAREVVEERLGRNLEESMFDHVVGIVISPAQKTGGAPDSSSCHASPKTCLFSNSNRC